MGEIARAYSVCWSLLALPCEAARATRARAPRGHQGRCPRIELIVDVWTRVARLQWKLDLDDPCLAGSICGQDWWLLLVEVELRSSSIALILSWRSGGALHRPHASQRRCNAAIHDPTHPACMIEARRLSRAMKHLDLTEPEPQAIEFEAYVIRAEQSMVIHALLVATNPLKNYWGIVTECQMRSISCLGRQT